MGTRRLTFSRQLMDLRRSPLGPGRVRVGHADLNTTARQAKSLFTGPEGRRGRPAGDGAVAGVAASDRGKRIARKPVR